MSDVDPLQSLLDEGVSLGVFPAAQATVWRGGRLLFEGYAGPADAATLFDLASITKVGTTLLFLSLNARGLPARTTLGSLLPTAYAPDLTLEDLLFHRSGLPAWRPFFALLGAMPELLAHRTPSAFARSRITVVDAALACPPERGVGERAVYSDVGFILLGEALARAAGMPLDELFDEAIARPLGLDMGYRRLSIPSNGVACAPTGTTRPRPPAPGQEGLHSLPFVPSPAGEVDDDNAWTMDGVAGHAGLFGTARTLGRLGQLILEDIEGAERMAPMSVWREAILRDTLTPGSERALGFDTVTPGASSAGRHLSPLTIGHLGFTGTSLWVDPAQRLVIALVTNRTLHSRSPELIRAFRPRFHDIAHTLEDVVR